MTSVGEPPQPTVVGHDELDDGSVEIDRWAELARGVLVTEGISGPAELTLVFVPTEAMAELNAEHMGGDGPTDVLAFPIDPEPETVPGESLRLLGDVVVCPEVAAANAAERGVAFDDELALLVVHGVLHIVGHDHDDAEEATRMQARERALLGALHTPTR